MQNNTFPVLFVGQKIVKLTEVDSTNNYLKNLLSNCEPLEEGTVILADHQFAGRGQFGNVWRSNNGENLTFSIFLEPFFLKVDEQFELNKAISLGIIDCLKTVLGKLCKIKWPNDIYYENSKIGGLLIENRVAGGCLKASIIGLGLNINQVEFGEMSQAASLKTILGKAVDKENVLKELCKSIEARYLMLKNSETKKIHSDYIDNLFRVNEMSRFRVLGQEILGKIVNVSQYGELLVEIESEVKIFNLKEISFEF